MTNGEKFKNEIIEKYQNLLKEKVIDGDGNRMNRAIKEIAYKYCGMRLLGASSTFKFLFEEYKESPVRLTRLEYGILDHILNNTEYSYITRERDGSLFIYKDKPVKTTYYWNCSDVNDFKYFNDLFPFIKWEDEGPTSIEKLLNNCEVVDNEND